MWTRFKWGRGVTNRHRARVNAGNRFARACDGRSLAHAAPNPLVIVLTRLAFGLIPIFAMTWPARGAAPADAEAAVVLIGDQHSAYERTAQLVAHVDRLHRENPQLPIAVLIDGDVLEHGNVVAARSAGTIDFAMLAALASRGPTILNLGNHEPEFYNLAETVRRVEATGVRVVSNIVNRATGQPFAPASLRLKLGANEVVVVGLCTDHLATFRVAVRPSLDLTDPVAWGKQNLPTLWREALVRIVLSHAGVRTDRELLPLVPDGTLFAGAHDHLRFVHHEGKTIYVHSGSWNECFTVAWLRRSAGATTPTWEVEQDAISVSDPADQPLAVAIDETETKFLTPVDTAVIGHLSQEFAPPEAARFIVAAVRRAANVDAAFVGNTTFGAGLPKGDVPRVALDACVRFDGTIFTGEVDGAQLRALVTQANQGPETPWSDRRGEYLVADAPAKIEADRRYRIAVTDWVARNPGNYFGRATLPLTEHPELKLKTIAAAAIAAAGK
jgi:5'-nucleotidase / UDP-sugar diphosphatase